MKRRKRRLEGNLQSVLNFTWTAVTWRAIAAGLSEVLLALPRSRKVPLHGIDCIARARRGRGTCNRPASQLSINLVRTELRFVKEVEELHPELHVHPFSDLEVLIRGEIGVGDSWSSARPGTFGSKRPKLIMVESK